MNNTNEIGLVNVGDALALAMQEATAETPVAVAEQPSTPPPQTSDGVTDEDINRAKELIAQELRVSSAAISRKLRVSQHKAWKIIEEMEARGLISKPVNDDGRREILFEIPSEKEKKAKSKRPAFVAGRGMGMAELFTLAEFQITLGRSSVAAFDDIVIENEMRKGNNTFCIRGSSPKAEDIMLVKGANDSFCDIMMDEKTIGKIHLTVWFESGKYIDYLPKTGTAMAVFSWKVDKEKCPLPDNELYDVLNVIKYVLYNKDKLAKQFEKQAKPINSLIVESPSVEFNSLQKIAFRRAEAKFEIDGFTIDKRRNSEDARVLKGDELIGYIKIREVHLANISWWSQAKQDDISYRSLHMKRMAGEVILKVLEEANKG